MNPETITTGLTAVQADGLACVICGLDYLCAPGSASVPVGRSVTSSQVFACIGLCAEAAGVGRAEIGSRTGGGPPMTATPPNTPTPRPDRALWLQCASTALVALGAAYASYRHGREFALRSGADETSAMLWPLVVDGLLTVATVELWKTGRGQPDRGQWKAWMAFLFGISLSLCANVAARRC